VRDRVLTGAVRAAYNDFLAASRHPYVVLFLELPRQSVDVNVHPAKAEVRFRDANLVRGLIVGGLKHALAEAGHRASTTTGAAALAALQPNIMGQPSAEALDVAYAMQAPLEGEGLAEAPGVSLFELPPSAPEAAVATEADAGPMHPLGVARAQLHETYIVAQTADGIVIVDQHAAHERLLYERMKAALSNGGVSRQMLLIPEVVELDEASAQRLVVRAAELAELGLVLEGFGPGTVAVREVPALLGDSDVAALVRDLAADLAAVDDAQALKDRLADVSGTMACHSAIRAGRRLNGPEMNALLRQMESTPHAGQCNHGRPTYVELKLKDIERLFGRR
jgi:DNA mismatch repair protein MutL